MKKRIPIFFIVSSIGICCAASSFAQTSMDDDVELETRIENAQKDIRKQERTIAELKKRFENILRRKQELQEFIDAENRRLEAQEKQKLGRQEQERRLKAQEAQKQKALREEEKAKECKARQEQQKKIQREKEQAQKQKEIRLTPKPTMQEPGSLQEKEQRAQEARNRRIARSIEEAQKASQKRYLQALGRLMKRKEKLQQEARELETAIHKEEENIKALEKARDLLLQRGKLTKG